MSDEKMDLSSKLVKIIQDDEVQRLSLLLRKFNPFEILKIGHYELRHTNTLAWLLDPAENHGLGDTFLRAFIARFGTTDGRDSITHRFEIAEDRTVTIRREVKLSHLKGNTAEGERLGLFGGDELNQDNAQALKKAIDIIVDSNDWVLAIEAKVRSQEGEEQLKDYQKALNAYVGGSEKLLTLVFLTIDGDGASESQWVSANWEENVITPLETALSIHHDLREDIRSFLTSYLSTLKRYAGSGDEVETLATRLATSERLKKPLQEIQEALKKRGKKKDLDEKTKRLLRRHAPTIRLLLAQTTSRQVTRAEQIETLLKDSGFERLTGPASYISFVPKQWKEKFPRMLAIDKGGVVFQIINRPSRLQLKLIIPSLGENFEDEMAKQRRTLMERIHQNKNNEINIFRHAFDRNNQPRKPSGQYDSVHIESFDLNGNVNDDEIKAWISGQLEDINNNKLKILESLMEESHLK